MVDAQRLMTRVMTLARRWRKSQAGNSDLDMVQIATSNIPGNDKPPQEFRPQKASQLLHSSHKPESNLTSHCYIAGKAEEPINAGASFSTSRCICGLDSPSLYLRLLFFGAFVSLAGRETSLRGVQYRYSTKSLILPNQNSALSMQQQFAVDELCVLNNFLIILSVYVPQHLILTPLTSKISVRKVHYS